MEFLKKIRWYFAQKVEKRFWDKWLKKNLSTMDKKWLNYVLEYFGISDFRNFENKIVVDIGSGPIGILTKLKAREKIAVDPLPIDSVDKSIRRIKSLGEEIPLESNLADSVFLYNVLQHVISPEKILEEGTRILKPGGTFYILEQLNLPISPAHPNSLKLEMFDKWVENNNFNVIKKAVEKDRYFDSDPAVSSTGYMILCLIVEKIKIYAGKRN